MTWILKPTSIFVQNDNPGTAILVCLPIYVILHESCFICTLLLNSAARDTYDDPVMLYSAPTTTTVIGSKQESLTITDLLVKPRLSSTMGW